MFWKSKNREAKAEPLPHETFAAANMARGFVFGMMTLLLAGLAARTWSTFGYKATQTDPWVVAWMALAAVFCGVLAFFVDRQFRRIIDESEAEMGVPAREESR